jgi:protoporphyrinogen oxidase
MNKLVKQGLVWLGAATIAVSLIACDSLFPPQGDLVERVSDGDTLILKSAYGKKTEGYKHQLFFHYPKSGGIETLFNEFKNELNEKNKFYLNKKILKVTKKNKKFYVKTNNKNFIFDKLYSTIPLGELVDLYSCKNPEVNFASQDLK